MNRGAHTNLTYQERILKGGLTFNTQQVTSKMTETNTHESLKTKVDQKSKC